MPFELQPTLEGDLVCLRPLKSEDFKALHHAASDPLIWEQHPQPDRYKVEVFRDGFFRTALESGGAFVILDNETDAIIGSSRFHDYKEAASEIEIGWSFLARGYWGGVYNGEVKSLMLRHAFQFVDNAVFVIGPENFRSRKAVEKVGGVLVGTRPDPERVVYRIQKSSGRF